jgi:hypothetical protein
MPIASRRMSEISPQSSEMGALNHPQLVGLLLGFPHWWWLFEHETPAGSRNLRSESLQEACWLVFSFLLGAYACAWAQVDVWLPDLGAYESYSSYSSGNSSVVHPAATRTLTCFSIQYSVWLVNYNRYALYAFCVFLCQWTQFSRFFGGGLLIDHNYVHLGKTFYGFALLLTSTLLLLSSFLGGCSMLQLIGDRKPWKLDPGFFPSNFSTLRWSWRKILGALGISIFHHSIIFHIKGQRSLKETRIKFPNHWTEKLWLTVVHR